MRREQALLSTSNLHTSNSPIAENNSAKGRQIVVNGGNVNITINEAPACSCTSSRQNGDCHRVGKKAHRKSVQNCYRPSATPHQREMQGTPHKSTNSSRIIRTAKLGGSNEVGLSPISSVNSRGVDSGLVKECPATSQETTVTEHSVGALSLDIQRQRAAINAALYGFDYDDTHNTSGDQ